MAAIPPNNHIDGFINAMEDGVRGAYKKGEKYGRYLAQQECLRLKEENEALRAELNCAIVTRDELAHDLRSLQELWAERGTRKDAKAIGRCIGWYMKGYKEGVEAGKGKNDAQTQTLPSLWTGAKSE